MTTGKTIALMQECFFRERCYLDYLICLCCCLFFKGKKKGGVGVGVKITMMGVGEGHEGSEFQTYLGERGNQLRAEVVAVGFLWGNY